MCRVANRSRLKFGAVLYQFHTKYVELVKDGAGLRLYDHIVYPSSHTIMHKSSITAFCLHRQPPLKFVALHIP